MHRGTYIHTLLILPQEYIFCMYVAQFVFTAICPTTQRTTIVRLPTYATINFQILTFFQQTSLTIVFSPFLIECVPISIVKSVIPMLTNLFLPDLCPPSTPSTVTQQSVQCRCHRLLLSKAEGDQAMLTKTRKSWLQ